MAFIVIYWGTGELYFRGTIAPPWYHSFWILKSYPSLLVMSIAFWSAQDIKIAPSGHANWSLLNVLAKYLFTTKTCFSQHYGKKSFDGDSFVSQSRFDAHAIGRNPLMGIPLLANQDLTPMLYQPFIQTWLCMTRSILFTFGTFMWSCWEQSQGRHPLSFLKSWVLQSVLHASY